VKIDLKRWSWRRGQVKIDLKRKKIDQRGEERRGEVKRRIFWCAKMMRKS
jgi:hypothetical protein